MTPTYHVYDLFTVHHNATLLTSHTGANTYDFGGKSIRAVNCSASMDEAGKIHVSLVNIHFNDAQTIACAFQDFKPRKASGQILVSAEVNAHNTFDDANAVRPRQFSDFRFMEDGLQIVLPARSVVVLEIEGVRGN